MTNLEYYKDEIYEIQRDLFEKRDICIAYGIGIAICDVYEKHKGVHAFMPMVLDWLLEEHKEPIKLKQWEFELIGYIYRTSSVKKMFFVHYSELNYLRGVGYFKGITNEYMTLKEILDNCEVIENE